MNDDEEIYDDDFYDDDDDDDNKQPQLYNTTNYRRRQHRRRRCSRSTSQRCWCLFGIILKLILLIIILVFLAILLSYIILQPRYFTCHVTHANLTHFNYNKNNSYNNTLRYNLVLNFTLHNPNKRLGFYLDKAEANALYQGSTFADTTPLKAPWFSYLLHTKSTVPMSVVLSGKRATALDTNEFERDARGGDFGIDVKVHFKIRFRVGDFIGHNMFGNARANCGIKVPYLRSGGGGSNNGIRVWAFEPTMCEVDF